MVEVEVEVEVEVKQTSPILFISRSAKQSSLTEQFTLSQMLMYLDHTLTSFGFHDVIQFTNRFEYIGM